MLLGYYQGICTLSIDKVFAEDEAEYSCLAQNPLGQDTTVAELLVESKYDLMIELFVVSNMVVYMFD